MNTGQTGHYLSGVQNRMLEIFEHVDLADIPPGPPLNSVDEIIGVPIVVGYPGNVNEKLISYKNALPYFAWDRKSFSVEYFFGFFTGKKTKSDETLLLYSVDDNQVVWVPPDDWKK